MKKAEIEIGGTYLAKVSGTVQPVQVLSESPHGGWNAYNHKTKRSIRIKSCQRLRRQVPTCDRCGRAVAYVLRRAINPATGKPCDLREPCLPLVIGMTA